MGFNTKYVPDVSVLEEQLLELGLAKFVKCYASADALIGDTSGITFLEKQIKKLQLHTEKD